MSYSSFVDKCDTNCEITPLQKANILIESINNALENGVQHFHPVTNNKLTNLKDILECLNKEGKVIITE